MAGDVTVTLGQVGHATLGFGPPIRRAHDPEHVEMRVVMEAPGLHAETEMALESWGGGASAFLSFFEDLAASWRGWDGKKTWHDDSAGVDSDGLGGYGLTIAATHDRVGTVQFDITCSRLHGGGRWNLRLAVSAEPGSLELTAMRFRQLLAHP